MRKVFLAIALFLVAALGSSHAQLTMMGAGGGFGGGSTAFSGIGDISLSAGSLQFWGGFRAYSLAKVGTAAARLKRASDNAEQDINSLANGQFDAASAATFCNATTCTVVFIYDKTGNTKCENSTAACNGIGTSLAYSATACNGKPGAVLNSATPSTALLPLFAGQNQPFTTVLVGSRTGNTSAFNPTLVTPGTGFGLYFNNTANSVILYAGGLGSPAATAADSSLHSLIGVFDDAVHNEISVDGTRTNVSGIAGGNFSAGNLVIGSNSFGSWSGNLCEYALINASSSAGDIAAITNNQRSAANGYNF